MIDVSVFLRAYSDEWGPCPISRISVCMWFVIFVDDCMHSTWLYQVPQVVLQFCEMIRNQVGKGRKCFQSDNAKEFFNLMAKLNFSRGFEIHESFCVDTPRQNGSAKRRIG